LVVVEAASAGQLDEAGAVRTGPASTGPAGAGSRAERQALVGEHGGERPPPVVLVAHEGIGWDSHVVEEDLVEVRVTRHLLQRPDGDTWRVLKGNDEHRDPAVLREVGVGASDAQG